MLLRWVFVSMLLTGLFAQSQVSNSIPFESISLEQGLPQSSVNVIFKDHLGYIWMGTEAGISRYNGLVVDNFEHEPNDQKSVKSISKGSRTAITEDDNGDIWTGSNNGSISVYQSSRNTWKNISLNYVNEFKAKYPSLFSNQTGWVFKLFYDRKRKKIYAATVQTGLYELDQVTGKVSRYWDANGFLNNNDLGINTILGITDCNQNDLMLLTDNGISIFDRNTRKISKSFFRNNDVNSKVSFFQAVEYEKGKYFISSSNGLYDFNLITGEYTVLTNKTTDSNSLSGNFTLALHLTADKKSLWVSVYGIGIDILDIQTKKINRINGETYPGSPIAGEVIYSIIEDKEGIVWIGTNSGGVLKYDPFKSRIKSVQDKTVQGLGLGFLTVRGTFYDSRNRIWIGSRDKGGGVTLLDIEKGESKRFFTDPEAEYFSWSFGEDKVHNIYALASSSKGDLLYRRSSNKMTFQFIANLTDARDKKKLPNYLRTYFMYLNSTGSLLIGGNKVIEVADSSGNIILKNYPSLEKLDDAVYDISNQPDGRTYILGMKHIWRWDEKTGVIYNMTPWYKLERERLSIMNYLVVLNDKFYLPTNGSGILVIDTKSKKTFSISKKDGIPNQYLYNLATDVNGNIWASSNRGLIKYLPGEKRFLNFSVSDGFQNIESNYYSFAKSKNGNFVYGGFKGINYFNPLNLTTSVNNEIFIVSVKKKDKISYINTSNYSGVVEVHHNENPLTINFLSLNFRNPSAVNYEYKMEGLDDDWLNAGNQNSITYNNLPAGTYTFKVKVINNGTEVAPREASIQITVIPPPWFTWWAFTLDGLALIGLVRFIVIYRVKQNKEKLENERRTKELEAAKSFQESMLPKKMPVRQDLDIVTFLRSSTEVGGDYYDFIETPEGDLFIVCGDATGHGTISGMMVSITKAGLNGIPPTSANEILAKLNKVIKKVDLGTMRMSMNILQLKENKVFISSAAMPPVYYFNARKQEVEEIEIGGLPLGGLKNAMYDLVEIEFNAGDILVLLTDGLPEAPNKKGDLFDYPRLKGAIQQCHHLSAEEIKISLIEEADAWMDGEHNPDDITIIVIKKR